MKPYNTCRQGDGKCSADELEEVGGTDEWIGAPKASVVAAFLGHELMKLAAIGMMVYGSAS